MSTINTAAPSVGAALQYAQKLLGGPLVENDSNPTIGTTVTPLVQGNGDRVALIIVNLGTNPLYISLTTDVSPSNGIAVAANGGNVTMNLIEDLTLPSRAWWAISIGAPNMVFILEMARFSLLPPGLP